MNTRRFFAFEMFEDKINFFKSDKVRVIEKASDPTQNFTIEVRIRSYVLGDFN